MRPAYEAMERVSVRFAAQLDATGRSLTRSADQSPGILIFPVARMQAYMIGRRFCAVRIAANRS